MSQVSQFTFVTTRFTTLLIVRVTCKHVNVKFYHVKFEVIRKYFSCYVNLIFVLEKEREILLYIF